MEVATKTDVVYSTIKERIESGDYTPGYRLVIDALARELGLSPIPVREAIRRLEAEGLVRHSPHVSAEVTGIDPSQYAEILTVLARLEGWVTSAASPSLTSDDIAGLSNIAHEMNRALDENHLERYARLNRDFHTKIREKCPNQFLKETVEHTWSLLDRVRHNIFVLVPARARDSLQDHYQIIQSLREHAPSKVLEALVEQHQLRTLEAYLAYLGQGNPMLAGEFPR